MKLTTFFLASILFAACGDDSTAADAAQSMVDAPTPDAGAPLTAEQACQGLNERLEGCGRLPQPQSECIAEYSCGAFFRADAIDLIVRCEIERECDEGDDRCFIASELGVTESAESMAFTSTCQAKRTECGDGFNEDFCYAQLASTESLGVMTTCLDNACGGDTIADCLSDAYDRTCN